MARFGQGFIQALTQPSYSQGLFELGGQIAERRREREQLARLDESMTTMRQANAAAQQGDVSALTRQINQLQAQAQSATTMKEKMFYLNQVYDLQAQIPNAQGIKQTRSVDALLRIDNELQDTNALRDRINQSYAQRGLAPISQQDFDKMVSALKTQQTRLQQDPDVNTEYTNRKINAARQDLELKKLQSAEWFGNNRKNIVNAIKSGNQEELDSVLETVPSLYAEQVQDFVSAELRFQKEMQDFRDNSISKNQEPLNKDFTSRIENLPEGLQDDGLKAMNQQYVEYIEKHWDAENKEWIGGTGAKKTAATLEENLNRLISNRNERATLNAWEAAEDKKLADERVIEEARIRIQTFVPDRNDEKDLAEQLAAEDQEDYDKLDPEEQQEYRRMARDTLVEEHKRRQQAVIAGVDVTQAPAQAITDEENIRLSMYTSEEQELIMEEYGEFQKGQMSLTQIMDELEEDGFIEIPVTDEEPPPQRTLYRKERGFRVLDEMKGRYERNIEGLAKRRAGNS